MLPLFAEYLTNERQRELLKQAAEAHLASQVLEANRLNGTQQRSWLKSARSWLYAALNWSGSRLIQVGTSLRKPYEQAISQDPLETAEACQAG